MCSLLGRNFGKLQIKAKATGGGGAGGGGPQGRVNCDGSGGCVQAEELGCLAWGRGAWLDEGTAVECGSHRHA